MAIILSIETSTDVCSVALHRGPELLCDINLYIEKAHSTHLAGLIEDLFKNTRLTKQEIDAIAVSEGPGSYTGLRIGASLAKGLCYGLNVPLIGINTLDAMAWQVYKKAPQTIIFKPPHLGIAYCPMLDARRMEVYYMLKNSEFETIRSTDNLVVDESSFEEYCQEFILICFGNGSAKTRQILEKTCQNIVFVDDIVCKAWAIGELANIKFSKKEFADLAYFEPSYYKEFIAGKPRKLV